MIYGARRPPQMTSKPPMMPKPIKPPMMPGQMARPLVGLQGKLKAVPRILTNRGAGLRPMSRR